MVHRPAVLERLPILILYPHNRCNCRCLMCDIWKTTDAREISEDDLRRHLDEIARLGVEQAVFSGGEPLMHSDLFQLARLLRQTGVKTTLLSAGLLFERLAPKIAASFDEVIISLDGPPAVHDAIRRVPGAFDALARGVAALRRERSDLPVQGRCTVQRANCRSLCETARSARWIGLRSISFLAADLTSEAFNRFGGWPAERQEPVAIPASDLAALDQELAALATAAPAGFVRESPEKLRRIARHFRAHLGLEEAIAPFCTAPWVSAVVETDGTVRPCFFHEPIGNAKADGLYTALNSGRARRFRQTLDIASNPVCRRCVCSLNRPLQAGLKGRGASSS